MNAVARAFPAGPTLATWWQQVSPLQPRELWVAHLAVHRVETLVRVEHPCRLDPLLLRILDALARAETMDAAERHTGLHRQFLHRALANLQADGLVTVRALGHWQITPAGRQALDTGAYGRLLQERRTFHFRVGIGEGAFLPLRRLAGEPGPAPPACPFDLATLDDGLQRPREWKEHHGFPLDVRGRAMPNAPAPADWRHVTVVTPIQMTMALVVTEELRGFASDEEGVLDTEQPIFTLRSAGSEVFPELAAPPNAETCATAWQEWCQVQGQPEAASRVELQGHELRIAPSTALDERLRSQAAGAWLLVGTGEVRRAARITIRET